MSQSQNEVTSESSNQYDAGLNEAIKELKKATKKREQAQRTRQALDQAGVFDNDTVQKEKWDRSINAKKAEEKDFATKVADLLISVQDPVDSNTQKRATAALNKVPPTPTEPPIFDWDKMIYVICGLLIFAAIFIFLVCKLPEVSMTLLGLIVSAVGQLFQSAGKSIDVQSKPRLKDGFELFGEVVKILGVLAALAGFVLKL